MSKVDNFWEKVNYTYPETLEEFERFYQEVSSSYSLEELRKNQEKYQEEFKRYLDDQGLLERLSFA